jgi:hypothetical protein
LLDTSRGIRGVAPGGKQRPRRAISEIRPEFVREVREQRDKPRQNLRYISAEIN